MIRTLIRKLSNPRRASVKRRTAKKRTKRKMSPKQMRIFGTKRQKAALKASRKRKANPRRVTVRRVKRRKRSNPALILTLGAANPHRKRRKPVAKKSTTRRRRRTTTNRRRTRRTNPKRVAVRRRRRTSTAPRRRRRSNTKVVVRYRNRSHRRKSTHHRRRNPSIFGTSMTSKEGLMIIGGGLAGVAAAKFIPTLLPASITGGIASSNIGKTVLTGVAAIAAGMIAGKFVDRGFGNGVLFGGLMQTASVALNAFLPNVYQQLGLSLGDLLPGQFPVPQNPIRAGIAQALPPTGAQARVTMNGLARAYGAAF